MPTVDRLETPLGPRLSKPLPPLAMAIRVRFVLSRWVIPSPSQASPAPTPAPAVVSASLSATALLTPTSPHPPTTPRRLASSWTTRADGRFTTPAPQWIPRWVRMPTALSPSRSHRPRPLMRRLEPTLITTSEWLQAGAPSTALHSTHLVTATRTPSGKTLRFPTRARSSLVTQLPTGRPSPRVSCRMVWRLTALAPPDQMRSSSVVTAVHR